ncbi:MAG: hypothetical protein AAGD05_14680, partial [Bacteroidota bacterium]
PQYPQDGRFLADLPSTITYFKLNDLEQTITNNYDGPAELRVLEEAIEQFFEALDWTKVQQQR